MRKNLLILSLVGLLLLAFAGIANAQAGQLPSNGARLATPANANQTGVDLTQLNKNEAGQKMHENYQNNTNACASCHITHNAVGAKLLFNGTESKVCSSCHDGTMGSFNVFADPAALRAAIDAAPGGTQAAKSSVAGGGTFMGNIVTGNASAHMANGVVTLSAAPGGDRLAGTPNWTATFNCSSCHEPHGSYSNALLTNNPNGSAFQNDAGGIPVGKVTYQLVFQAVFDPGDGGPVVNNVWVATTDGTPAGIKKGPWLYSSDYTTKKYGSRLFLATGTYDADWKATAGAGNGKAFNDPINLYVNYGRGYIVPAAIDPGTTTLKLQAAVPVIVKFTGTSGNYTDYGTGSSVFCAACHTDYNSSSATVLSGTYSMSYRHNIAKGVKTGMQGDGAAKMVCLTCHYAHGTSAEIQRDSSDTYVAMVGAVPQDKDQNASSALKKYINMSVCWKCHQTSHADAFMNSNSYWANH